MTFIKDIENQLATETGFRHFVHKVAFKAQTSFYMTLSERLDLHEARLGANDKRLDACEGRLATDEGRLGAYEQHLGENARQQQELIYKQQGNEDEIDRLRVKVSLLQKKLDQIETSGVFVQAPQASDNQPAPQPAKPKHDDKYREIDYFDFENHFRGSRDLIKERQSIYLPYFKDCGGVADLGCGRGEFLELMADNGIPAKGVDTYEEYVELCRERGYEAECTDAVSYLERCEDDSLGGIFLGQVVEHLDLSYLIYLCELTYKKAKPGAHVIMETPNPMCLAIFSAAFYVDPSHNKPVHPLLLQYLMEKAGFKQTEIMFTEPSKVPTHIPELHIAGVENLDQFNDAMVSVNNMLFGSQDYAIIATKD